MMWLAEGRTTVDECTQEVPGRVASASGPVGVRVSPADRPPRPGPGGAPGGARQWVRQAEANQGTRADRPTTAELEELRRLRKENAELRRANEIFPNDAAVTRLATAVLIEAHDEWQIADRRYLSEGSMALLSPISDDGGWPKEVRRATAELGWQLSKEGECRNRKTCFASSRSEARTRHAPLTQSGRGSKRMLVWSS